MVDPNAKVYYYKVYRFNFLFLEIFTLGQKKTNTQSLTAMLDFMVNKEIKVILHFIINNEINHSFFGLVL
jgi:hypothetical protein